MADKSQIMVGNGRSPATAPSAGSSASAHNGSHRRTYDGLFELLGDGLAVLRSARRLRSIYVHKRVDAALREQIMLAVSRVNACRWCAYVHETRAAQQSAGTAELADVTAATRASDSRARAAVAYAVARAEAGRGRRPHPQVDQAFRARFDAQERHDIEAIICLITFANLSANSLHSLSDRLRPSGRRTVAQVGHAAGIRAATGASEDR